jgi:hypothetical protein
MKTIFILPCIILSLTVIELPLTVRADSARSSAITSWGDCDGGSRSWWDDMCMKWRKTMGARGWSEWWRNYELVTIDRYVDKDISAWGNDQNNLDGGDAALICTHGGFDDGGWYGLMHHRVNGECGLNVNQMILGPGNGNGRLRFFQMSSCNSIRWPYRGQWFSAASGKVHALMGFHGYMYIGWMYVNEYGSQANKGFSKGAALAWMDEMYHEDHWYNVYKNLCPMALGFGDTTGTAVNALNERYNSHWPDRQPHWMATSYYPKCDPDGGDRLPN